jgi:dTDP-4-amino-4,6-dideoxygalactose transaminase
MMTGARPVFADIDPERLTIDPTAVEAAVTSRTRAILPVHLYGQPADMRAIERVASRHQLAIVEDACQAHFATTDGRPVGSIGACGTFSFYPTKNLGALGDGGAITTHDEPLADRIRRLRNGGQTSRYQHVEAGTNSRLDELQAAILRARLTFMPGWTARRRHLAAMYRRELTNPLVRVPREHDSGHVYHLFPVLCASRAALQAHLASAAVETLIHYPVPIPRQPALIGAEPRDCPVADRICDEVVSLPLYPALPDEAVLRIADAVNRFTG